MHDRERALGVGAVDAAGQREVGAQPVVADLVVELDVHPEEPLAGAQLEGRHHVDETGSSLRRAHDRSSPTACAGQGYEAVTTVLARTGPASSTRTARARVGRRRCRRRAASSCRCRRRRRRRRAAEARPAEAVGRRSVTCRRRDRPRPAGARWPECAPRRAPRYRVRHPRPRGTCASRSRARDRRRRRPRAPARGADGWRWWHPPRPARAGSPWSLRGRARSPRARRRGT